VRTGRSSGVQEFRSSGVQEFRSSKLKVEEKRKRFNTEGTEGRTQRTRREEHRGKNTLRPR
jgi:hypothetical protein